jgi:hypothetical protein
MFGFLDPVQACLTESFLLGNNANRVNLCLDIARNELAVATHAAFQVDKVVGMADSADAPSDRLALLGEALVLSACSLRFLCDLLQPCSGLGRPTRATLCRRIAGVVELLLHLL